MSYTFTETETFTIDSTFDSLYTDSLADFEGGTVGFDEDATDSDKKTRIIQLINEQGYNSMKNIVVAKDGTACLYIQGKFEDNTYTWKNVLVGKISNSKAWTWTSEFHQANKSWIQSLGGTKFALECIKDSRIDTYFTAATNSGICLGNLTTQDSDNNMKLMTWEY
tara:strand:+ start:1533 stop:2030 length:498 start_codon:yes stop_codon:yes gene_type:complete